MPLALILVGIPNSGKSTYAKKLIKTFSHKPFRIVSRDAIRMVAFNLSRYNDYKFTRENELRVTKIHQHILDDYTKTKQNIIIDNTNCKEGYIDEYVTYFERKGYIIKIKYFDVSLAKAQVRNIKRGLFNRKYIPYSVLVQMKTNYDNLNRSKYKEYEYANLPKT